MEVIPKPKSRFLRVKCMDCGNEQVIFGCASTLIRCIICNKVLAEPTGGKAEVKTKVIEILE
ncbi:MAG: 30S ribosomal protein S27e [Candidatus Hydrothermarchaeota archaeon]